MHGFMIRAAWGVFLKYFKVQFSNPLLTSAVQQCMRILSRGRGGGTDRALTSASIISSISLLHRSLTKQVSP